MDRRDRGADERLQVGLHRPARGRVVTRMAGDGHHGDGTAMDRGCPAIGSTPGTGNASCGLDHPLDTAFEVLAPVACATGEHVAVQVDQDPLDWAVQNVNDAGGISELGENRYAVDRGLIDKYLGNLDARHNLCHGSPAEVRAEVIRCLDYGRSTAGGHILHASHSCHEDVRAENYRAVVAAYREFFGLAPLPE